MRDGLRKDVIIKLVKKVFSVSPAVEEIGDPIKSAYGYHIIQVLAHEDARVKSFAEVKGELAQQWKEQRVSAMIQKASDGAQAARCGRQARLCSSRTRRRG